MANIEFNAAAEAMRSIAQRSMLQNVLYWHADGVDNFVPSGDAGYAPITLTDASVGTSKNRVSIIGNSISVPDQTQLVIDLPSGGFESVYGILNTRIRVPAQDSGTTNVYVRAYFQHGTNYATKSEITTAIDFTVEHGMLMPLVFFIPYNRIDANNDGNYRLSFETVRSAVFDGFDLLLFANAWGRQFT